MDIYALAMCAQRISGETVFTKILPAITRNARSPEEAMGIGLKIANKEFPIKDGWYGHVVSQMVIPEEFIKLLKGYNVRDRYHPHG